MKKTILGTLCFLLLITYIGCGGIPPTFYYRIDYPLTDANQNVTIPGTLGIAMFDADVLYEGDKIVYRNTPYEVQFYHYRRWIAPPKKIVTEKIVKHYQSENVFQNVVAIPSATKIDYVLRGKIQAFEEWDEGNAWYGVVTLEFNLHDGKTNEIIWGRVFTDRTLAQKREATEVVKAISQSLSKVVQKSADGIRAYWQSNNVSN